MSFLDDIKPDLDAIRAGVPGEMGLRPIGLTVRVRTWSGTRPGDGTKTDVDTAITNADGYNYKVTSVSTKDIALSGGKYQSGQFKVGPLTPTYAGGVVTFPLLDPAVTRGVVREVLYKLSDPLTTDIWLKKVDLDTLNQLHWYLVLEPTGQGP